MVRIAIIVGTTRPTRKAVSVARWVEEIAASRDHADASFEIVDIADYGLPHLDEPDPPALGRYTHPHTRRWAETIARFDAYVFVTPEYNHAPSGSLKTALDFISGEWGDKAAGFVGYGYSGGVRAVEQLRLIMGGLRIADVKAQVSLSLHADFSGASDLDPAPHQGAAVEALLDEVIAWGGALKALRSSAMRSVPLPTG